MASTMKLSYKRLKNEGGFVDEDGDKEVEDAKAEEWNVNWRVSRWSTIRKRAGKKRPKIRIPGLRRFMRRKAKVVSSLVRFSWSNLYKRLKEGKPYIADLFAGNYLLTQVTPSPLKYIDKPYMSLGLHGYTSETTLGKIA